MMCGTSANSQPIARYALPKWPIREEYHGAQFEYHGTHLEYLPIESCAQGHLAQLGTTVKNKTFYTAPCIWSGVWS